MTSLLMTLLNVTCCCSALDLRRTFASGAPTSTSLNRAPESFGW